MVMQISAAWSSPNFHSGKSYVKKNNSCLLFSNCQVSGFDNWCILHMYIHLSFYWHHMILDRRTLTHMLISSQWLFKVSKIFLVPYNFILFESLLLYIWPLILFLFPWKWQLLYWLHCLKETLFFNFLYKLLLNIIYVFIIKLWKSCTCAQLWVLLEGTVF